MEEIWIKRAEKVEEWYPKLMEMKHLVKKEVAKKEDVQQSVKLQKYTFAVETLQTG